MPRTTLVLGASERWMVLGYSGFQCCHKEPEFGHFRPPLALAARCAGPVLSATAHRRLLRGQLHSRGSRRRASRHLAPTRLVPRRFATSRWALYRLAGPIWHSTSGQARAL